MTDFFSSYLFLWIAIILLVVALYFKKNWLYFIDSFAWLFTGLYAISHQDTAQPFILFLGLFALIVALVMGVAGYKVNKPEKPLWRNPNDPETWDQEEYEARLAEKERAEKLKLK